MVENRITGKRSEREHWDRFWVSSGEAGEIYSNEGRVSDRLAEITDLTGKRVLEVGAGSGRDGIMLARRGAIVISLDYSRPSLSMISSQIRGGDRIELCCGDAFALPFPDGTFDIVFHQGLLEHFRNPDDLLEENRRVLRPGGYLLVDVPQRFHYYTLIKHLLIAVGKWFAGWETEFSIGELERRLERLSFSVVESYGEWFNPPIWYRMLRKGLLAADLRLPMYPRLFTAIGRIFAGFRSRLLRMRWALYTTVVIGTIARKE